MAEQHYHEYEAYLVKMAEGNITDGVIYEPRAYSDMLPLLPLPQESFGHQEVFRNGEDFPVVITHMTASTTLFEQDGETEQDERFIQQIGLYMKFHGQYYMNPPQSFELNFGGVISNLQVAAPLPAWVNKNVATSEAISRGTTTWRFPRPFILSVRDSLRVEVMTPYTPDGTRFVTVSFTGIGAISRQVYQFNGTALLIDNSSVIIDAEQYINDGAEPVLITDMIVVTQPESGQVNTVGDARAVFIAVRQIGNGTGASWFNGPLNFTVPGTGVVLPDNQLGGINAGPTTGRAVVHEFPRALIWEPGEGIDVIASSLSANTTDSTLQIALLGYIAVQ